MTFEFSITCNKEDGGCLFTEVSVSRLSTASSYILVNVDIYIYSRLYISLMYFISPPSHNIHISLVLAYILFNLNIILIINSKMILAVSIATRLIRSTTFVKMKRAEIASLGHLFFHSNQGMKMNHVLSQISLSSLLQRKG